jgi:hypothetical protein
MKGLIERKRIDETMHSVKIWALSIILISIFIIMAMGFKFFTSASIREDGDLILMALFIIFGIAYTIGVSIPALFLFMWLNRLGFRHINNELHFKIYSALCATILLILTFFAILGWILNWYIIPCEIAILCSIWYYKLSF